MNIKIINGFLIAVIILGSVYLVYSFVVPVSDMQDITETITPIDDVEDQEISQTNMIEPEILSVSVGDEIAGMRVVTIKPFREDIDLPLSQNLHIEFSGETQLSGTIFAEDLSGLDCFDVDESSENKLPKIKEDTRSTWFCFSNEEGVINQYGTGEVTIVIDSYEINFYPSAATNMARLVRVIE